MNFVEQHPWEVWCPKLVLTETACGLMQFNSRYSNKELACLQAIRRGGEVRGPNGVIMNYRECVMISNFILPDSSQRRQC